MQRARTVSHQVELDGSVENRTRLSTIEWLEELGFVVDRSKLDLEELVINESAAKKIA